MWLWKKFWNTDIIGKIYILIILFIVVVATITVITRYNNANKKVAEQKQNTNNMEQVSQLNTIEISKFENRIIENTAEINSKIETIKTEKKQTNSNNSKIVTDSTPQPKAQEASNKLKEEIVEKEKIKNAEPMDAEIEELPTSVSTNKVEEYKVNNTMIEKMRNVINNNPSELMTQYGYNVEVDSSIINLTNQFTFTEQRVKNMLSYKFGTIRVYSQDYYVNGEYVWTECYLI